MVGHSRFASLTAYLALVSLVLVAVGCDAAIGQDSAVPPAEPRVESDAAARTRDERGGATSASAAEGEAEVDESAPPTQRIPSGPGAGVVQGRLVQAGLGVPIADAVVSLIEADRRTITAPDGSFRFDGVVRGPLHVLYGPAPQHVAQSAPVHVGADGLDIGLVSLAPAEPAVLITGEHGGTVTGCTRTKLVVAPDGVEETTEMSVTCLDSPTSFPAPPPAGRLPLAALDLAPAGTHLPAPADLIVSLPPQPRFADGVALDLLQLDAYSLQWVPAGVITVTASGAWAQGSVRELGSYLIAAPPFGSLPDASEGEPAIPRYGISDRAEGPPVSEFVAGTVLVYADFEYGGMQNTTVTIQTTDGEGTLYFESTRPYAQSGADSAPMVGPQGRWPIGVYQTNWFVGEPPRSVGKAVTWRVVAAPRAAPTLDVRALAVPGGSDASGSFGLGSAPGSGPSVPGGIAPPALQGGAAGISAACPAPKGWYEYVVRAGDTLTGLAQSTASELSRLVAANCLKSPTLWIGQSIALPANPRGPSIVKPPVGIPASPGLALPTVVGPAATPVPAKPRDSVSPTLAPRPSAYETPYAPPAVPSAAPAAAGASERSGAGPGSTGTRGTGPGSPGGVGAGSVPPTPEPTKARAPEQPTLAPRPTPAPVAAP